MDEDQNADTQREYIFPPESFEGKYIFDLPFPVVDAYCWNCLHWSKSFKIRRRQLTTGSVEYSVASVATPDYEYAILKLQMVDHETTIVIGESKEDFGFKGSLAEFLPSRIASFIKGERQWTTQLREFRRNNPPQLREDMNITLLMLAPQDKSQRKVGRPPASDNEWARQEIQRGRTQEDVFASYLQRQNIDTTNEAAVRQARDRFRKAVRRNKGK